MEHLYELEFFDSSQEYQENFRVAKELIKEQGVDVCRDEMTSAVITHYLNSVSFGFFIVSKRAYPLRNRGRTSKAYILNGYILASYSKEDEEVSIDIICSRKNYKYGEILMQAVENYSKVLLCRKMTLQSLPEEKLLNFYKKCGFSLKKETLLPSGDIKVLQMDKRLK